MIKIKKKKKKFEKWTIWVNPPSEVFHIKSTAIFQKFAFDVGESLDDVGSPMLSPGSPVATRRCPVTPESSMGGARWGGARRVGAGCGGAGAWWGGAGWGCPANSFLRSSSFLGCMPDTVPPPSRSEQTLRLVGL